VARITAVRGYQGHRDFSSLKSEDYHFMVRILLGSLVDAQQGNGIAWRLSYQAKFFNVVFKLPVLFIVGDCQIFEQN
jgi:hypothetical protein